MGRNELRPRCETKQDANRQFGGLKTSRGLLTGALHENGDTAIVSNLKDGTNDDDTHATAAARPEREEVLNKEEKEFDLDTDSDDTESVTEYTGELVSDSLFALKTEQKIEDLFKKIDRQDLPRFYKALFECVNNSTNMNQKLGVAFGVSNVKGLKNEDRFLVEPKFTTLTPTAFVGVCDGHGGCETADYIVIHACSLMKSLVRECQDQNYGPCLKSLVNQIDEKLLELHNEQNRPVVKTLTHTSKTGSGSTALLAAVHFDNEGHLTVTYANTGDSRAVVSYGSGIAHQVTNDHNTSNADEVNQIMAIDSSIIVGKRLFRAIEVTRSLGDHQYKDGRGGLISNPDVFVKRVLPSDEFVILATDGVFDGIGGNQPAVDLVRRVLFDTKDADKAAEALTQMASKQTRDDCTAVVIVFAGYQNLSTSQNPSTPPNKKQRIM